MNSHHSAESTRSAGVFWPAVFAAAALGALAPILYFGIHEFTHHRPLGAATLSVMCLAAFLGLYALSWRLRVGRSVALVALATTVFGLAVVAFMG